MSSNPPGWATAAAIMILFPKGNWHYKDITEYLLRFKTSKLGANGARPEQSMGRVMRQYPKIFVRDINTKSGYYSVDVDNALASPKVSNATHNIIKEVAAKYGKLVSEVLDLRHKASTRYDPRYDDQKAWLAELGGALKTFSDIFEQLY